MFLGSIGGEHYIVVYNVWEELIRGPGMRDNAEDLLFLGGPQLDILFSGGYFGRVDELV